MKAVAGWIKQHHQIVIDVTLTRVVPPLVLALLFVLLNHAYNQWTGLGQYYFFRRTVAATAVAVVLFGPAMLLGRRFRFIYLFVVSLLVSALFSLHFVYTSYAGGFFSVSALSYFWQVESLGGSIQALLGPELLMFLTPLLAVAVLFAVRPRSKHAEVISKSTRGLLAAGLVLIPLIATTYVLYKEAKQEGSIAKLLPHPHNSDELVKKVGIVNYTIYDVYQYVARHRGLTAAERTYIAETKSTYQFKPEGSQSFGAVKGKNVIYVQLESIQEFLIGRSVKGQLVMPNLTKLAGQSLHFTNFHYTVGPGTSSDSEFSTLNSLMHLGDAATFFEHPNNHYRALPEVLREDGYTTVALHGDRRFFWNRANVYPSFGYDHYYAEEHYTVHETGLAWGVSDNDFLHQSIPKLQELKQPYWAHVITLSSHTPFIIPDEYRELDVSGLNLSTLQKDYLHAAHYADKALGRFMDELESSGLLSNTMVVLTGDHEGFITGRDDQPFAQFLGYPNGFNDLSFLAARQVPLLIYNSGLKAAQINTPSSPLDIYPTITNLLGVATPTTVLGHDLLNTQKPLMVRRQRSVGAAIEVAMSKDFTYVTGLGSSRFEDGHCYHRAQATQLQDCRPLFDYATNEILLSDLIVKGNALELFK